MRAQPELLSGLLAWVTIVGGVFYFAAKPADSLRSAAVQGALLGAVIYGTYELTNQSVIATWSWGLAATDMAWGTFACTGVAALQHQLLAWCLKRGSGVGVPAAS